MTALLLAYDDVLGARDFFVNTLGFVEERSVAGDEGTLVRSHVRLGDTMLLLDKPGAHGILSPAQVGGVTHLVVVTVPDVEAHHASAVAAGATILVPLTSRPWGPDYEVQDREGYVFSFISEPAP